MAQARVLVWKAPEPKQAAWPWCTTASLKTTTSCVLRFASQGLCVFSSQTDTEVIAHLVDSLVQGRRVRSRQGCTVLQLHGAYAIAVFHKDEPQRVVGARAGSPLILGVGQRTQRNLFGE